MEKELLETILKRSCKDGSVAKVISMDSCSAVGKYQNFMSQVTRVTMKVVLGNGRTATRSLFVKESSGACEAANDMIKNYDVFKVETMMYENVLKEMEYLLAEYEDTDGVLWCKLIHHVPYTCLVLEDLKPSGFSIVDRITFFDLEHSLLVMNSLGRFHGMCKILEERGLINKDGYKPWHNSNPDFHKYWIWCLNFLAQGIKKYWNSKWSNIVDKMLISEEDMTLRMKKVEVDNEKFTVLNYGDCNKNNLMFKYDWQKRPIAMRFVDFQMPHYHNPYCDLMTIIYLDVDPAVRREHFDKLLRTYYESLVRTLDKFQFGGKKPDFEEISSGMDRFHYLGLTFLLTTYTTFINSERLDEFVNFDTLIKTEGKEGINIIMYDSKSLEEVLSPDLEVYLNKFF